MTTSPSAARPATRLAQLLAGAVATLATVGARADIETVTYDSVLPEASLFSFFEIGDPGFDTIQEPVTGLPKFDPALGTLIDATIEFYFDYSRDLYIESQGILNPGIPHFASATFGQIAAGVIFEDLNGTINGLVDLQFGAGVGCMGNPGDGDACSDSTFEAASFSAFDYSFIGDFAPEEIIGTGELAMFEFTLDFIDLSFDLDNVDYAFVDAFMYVEPGTAFVSVTYTYETGSAPDSDGDGVSDALDSCINVPNPDQYDSDGDGYGNVCDSDVNNDCIVNPIDLGALKSGFFGTDPDLDFNGDGVVNPLDLGILKRNFFAPPGPSGLTNACDP